MLQQSVPDEWRGRVIGVYSMSFAGTAPHRRPALGLAGRPDRPHRHAHPQRRADRRRRPAGPLAPAQPPRGPARPDEEPDAVTATPFASQRHLRSRLCSFARGCGAMGTATVELMQAAHTAPRRVYGLIVAFNLTRGPGFPPGGDAEPRAEVRVDPSPALHSALTPMTPHERDPCVERSDGNIRAPNPAGISPPTVNTHQRHPRQAPCTGAAGEGRGSTQVSTCARSTQSGCWLRSLRAGGQSITPRSRPTANRELKRRVAWVPAGGYPGLDPGAGMTSPR